MAVKEKKAKAPVATAPPVLAEPAPDKVYGWNVMSTCLEPDAVLEHKSKHDYLSLLVARTPENDWVGGYLCRTAMGTLASSDVSLKGARFTTSKGAAQWAAGHIISLPQAQKLTPNTLRILQSLVGVTPVAEHPAIEQEPELPWLDSKGRVLHVGDLVKVLPDVSTRLSGKLANVIGNYDSSSKSIEIEVLGEDGLSNPRILPGYLAFELKGHLNAAATETSEAIAPVAASTEVVLSMEAWDLLSKIILLDHAPVANCQGASAQLAELQVAGLIEVVGDGFRATAAGIVADGVEVELPRTPHDDMRDAHQAGLRMVPLASIVVTTNTRKVFDEAALAELAESVKAHGILQPVVLRPHPTEEHRYELVAGGRRYRAAQLAELAEVPATVRNLTDRGFLEVQLLENLQRVDVRPADEAQAFSKLLKNDFSAEEVALKVGKPVKFVLQRAKLVALIPFWMELLEADRLPLVAAHELARLPEAAQQVVQRYIEKEWGYLLKNGGTLESARISRIVSEQVLGELSKAPFPLDDATLYPKAGACLACPKRSCANPRLFDEVEHAGTDLCLDKACYAEKKVRLVARQIKRLTAELGQAPPLISLSYYTEHKQAITKDKYSEANPDAAGAVQAVVIEGPDAGTIRWVVVKNAVANQEQKKTDRSAEIRVAKINEANRALLTRHLYTQALSGRVLEQHIEQELYGQLRSQGGPHTPLRLALANDFGWELPEGGEAALRKLTPASNYQGLWAWVKQNIEKLDYDQKLALYFAMLGYNCSTFDSGNKRLTEYGKLAGADTNHLLKLATESISAGKAKKQEVPA